ncbi:hypothetical protein P5673_021249 [Acropora cervicornis]|uniref:Uncharacterized protein n=1 Tax=Acropora cervicornis TaxID=6130 RepID=A0AAD9V0H6_ACRCE|nr:hypothetical protein P5673_021249 [Acropora cervicornis]
MMKLGLGQLCQYLARSQFLSKTHAWPRLRSHEIRRSLLKDPVYNDTITEEANHEDSGEDY